MQSSQVFRTRISTRQFGMDSNAFTVIITISTVTISITTSIITCIPMATIIITIVITNTTYFAAPRKPRTRRSLSSSSMSSSSGPISAADPSSRSWQSAVDLAFGHWHILAYNMH